MSMPWSKIIERCSNDVMDWPLICHFWLLIRKHLVSSSMMVREKQSRNLPIIDSLIISVRPEMQAWEESSAYSSVDGL